MNATLRGKLDQLEARYEELGQQLSAPEVICDPRRLREISRARARLEKTVALYHQIRSLEQDVAEAEQLLREEEDPDLAQELRAMETKRPELERALLLQLAPRDPNDEKDVIVEIRAGTGGDEAALFAGDLFRMYSRYAESQGWKVEGMQSSLGEVGGFKEVIFSIAGEGAYSRLKRESGVHRVQRVPATEASGRLHTSAATVAVLPEAEEVEVQSDPDELKIEAYRASGPGGQHMQKNETAVRITHLPTGMVAACQDQRSQQQNRERALRILRARLLERLQAEQASEIARARQSMVGSGDRSEKIRTYNFPQDRLTDHRLKRSWHNLPALLAGEIGPVLDALREAEEEELISRAAKASLPG